MKIIYKYPITSDRCVLTVPYRCHVLSIQYDPNGELCVWILHDIEPDRFKKYEVMVVGTGQEIDEPLIEMSTYDDNSFNYVQTVVQGPFVWHVFLRELFE